MAVKIKNRLVTKRFAVYNDDCIKVMRTLPDESVHFSIYSPPFASLYSYTDELEDMGNCRDYADFFEHYKYLVAEHWRTMATGRIVAVHCMDLPTYKRNGEEIGLRDFSGDLVRCFQDAGFVFHSRHCIWKDPLVAATRTKALGLAHKQIIKDSTMCRMGIPDYILAFRKPGENPRPVKHPRGLTAYYGAREVPHKFDGFLMPMDTINGVNPYDSKTDKRSHWIWQQYASPVWFDIRQTRVLQFRSARDPDDERHICPLQLDVIERCMELWSRKGDVVLSPFMGIASEIFVAVKNGRKGIGIELKERYYRVALRNLKAAVQQRERAVLA